MSAVSEKLNWPNSQVTKRLNVGAHNIHYFPLLSNDIEVNSNLLTTGLADVKLQKSTQR